MTLMRVVSREGGSLDISVCIATFRRAQGLGRLLESVRRVCERADLSVEIIVVDNDVDETARPVAEAMKKKFKWLRYFVEPQQNIALTRNRGVREARGMWIAFIDDDETAGDNWLGAYWDMAAKRPGDGYFGPALARLEDAVPTWMDKDLFFGRPRFATGTRLLETWQMRTTNAFIRRSLFDAHRFDPRYGLTGGEDSDLFGRLLEAEAVFYWCDEAETYEYYPAQRLCLQWLIQRAFRGGYTYTMIKRRRQTRFCRQIPTVAKAVGGVCVFAVMLPVEILRGRKYAAKRLLRISTQLGHIWASLNLPYEEYRVGSRGVLAAGPVVNEVLAAGGRREDDI